MNGNNGNNERGKNIRTGALVLAVGLLAATQAKDCCNGRKPAISSNCQTQELCIDKKYCPKKGDGNCEANKGEMDPKDKNYDPASCRCKLLFAKVTKCEDDLEQNRKLCPSECPTPQPDMGVKPDTQAAPKAEPKAPAKKQGRKAAKAEVPVEAPVSGAAKPLDRVDFQNKGFLDSIVDKGIGKAITAALTVLDNGDKIRVRLHIGMNGAVRITNIGGEPADKVRQVLEAKGIRELCPKTVPNKFGEAYVHTFSMTVRK